jgi:UDP-glucuronate 4-epimerase
MKILVTGTAGFIGFHLASKLLEKGEEVFGLDSISNYYDIDLKYARLKQNGINKNSIVYNQIIKSTVHPNYSFIQLELQDKQNLNELFALRQFDVVVNLAAQAGVRHSLTNPQVYVESNIVGFLNLLECCRHNNIKHLVYASSSSVYGLNEKVPFSTSQNTEHPISLYAASKKSNELMAHAYSHLFNLPTTGLRFFTVYGTWGRPDMALFLFTQAILSGKPIQVFNHGNMLRDFTYVDDIVEGVIRVIDHSPSFDKSWNPSDPDPSSSKTSYKIYNLGNNSAIKLLAYTLSWRPSR